MSQMNKNILVIIMFVLGITNLYAQSDIVDVQLVYNNTADVNESISNLVKVGELKEAIQANGDIDQNLIVRIAFFDKNVVGRMTLIKEHKLSIDDYVSEWQKMVENKNAVLFLFVKAFEKDTYDFDKMYVSTKLSNDHLLPSVTENINENLIGSNEEIISNGSHYLAKALISIDISNKVQWVSQFDSSLFKDCSCFKNQACCRRACEYMLGYTTGCITQNFEHIEIAGFSNNTDDYSMEEYNNEPLIFYKYKLDDLYDYLRKELKNGHPIIIGVHHKRSTRPPNNNLKATCHWLVVVGIGIENSTKYIRFYDPGRTLVNEAGATSESNKFMYDNGKGCYECVYRNETYTITEYLKK